MFIKKLFLGNLNRSQFFWSWIASTVFILVLIFIIGMMSTSIAGANYPLIVIFLAVLLIFYRTSLYVRRLRDAGLTVWISAISILTPLDFILFLILLFIPSKQ